MGKEFWKEKYCTLKEKIIDRYDYWYHMYLQMDISENGSADFFIGDFDEFLYNLEICKEINEAIDYLINDNFDDLLLKFIELKKITDNRVLSNPECDLNYANEFVFEDLKKGVVKKPVIRLNQSISNKETILKEIYKFLYKHSYIECLEELFLTHFEPNTEWDSKILWNSNIVSIVGLIDDLFVRNILPKTQKRLRNKTVVSHFKNINGDFKMESVKTEGTNVCDTKKYQEIHDFTYSLKIDFD